MNHSNDARLWRIVALSSEIIAGSPVRVVCGSQELVLFRDGEGVCRALADRCAHRRAPLSGGRITEQFVIECPYHGWRYNGATGACVAIPNLRPDEKIPKNYRVQAFDTLESDGFIQLSFGAGETQAAPEEVSLPELQRHWEGQRDLAYPDELFMDTLVDCPSSILAIPGIQILDEHPFGDPVLHGDRISIDYAAVAARRRSRPPKNVAEDFAYTLRISASKSIARISLYSNDTAQLQATAVVVAVPTGQRITRALWRGAAPADSAATMIRCREHVDPRPVQASNNIASKSWSRTVALKALS